jgi:hypothetical protein
LLVGGASLSPKPSMMKVFGQNSDMQVIAVLRGGREARVCLDENPGVKEYLCCLGSPKKSWSDAYRELVEQRARVQERPCRTRANYITILENVQVDASNLGPVGFSGPIYVHVNTTVTTPLCSNIIAAVDPLQAGRHSCCRVTERAWGDWIQSARGNSSSVYGCMVV